MLLSGWIWLLHRGPLYRKVLVLYAIMPRANLACCFHPEASLHAHQSVPETSSVPVAAEALRSASTAQGQPPLARVFYLALLAILHPLVPSQSLGSLPHSSLDPV